MEKKAFLDRLTDDERASLQNQMLIRQHKNKSTIIAHDDESRDVYFVLEGMARATIFGSGTPVHLRDIPEGEIFGELAAIDDLTRSANIVAVGKVTCGSLSSAQFHNLVETKPSFTWALLSHLSQQSRTMTERIYEFSTMFVKPRLIRELLRLAQPNRENVLVVETSLTQEDIAGWIGSHREQVNRFLSEFHDLGLIDKSKTKRIKLLDPSGLEAECEKAEKSRDR